MVKPGNKATAVSYDAAVESFTKSRRFKRLGGKTQTQYIAGMRRFGEYCPVKLIRNITAAHITAFYNRRRANAPVGAVADIKSVAALFKHALQYDWVTKNWANMVETDPIPARKTIWQPHEYGAMIDMATRMGLPYMADAICMAYNTGQRKGDILALRWSDIDWTGDCTGVIHITQQKTGEQVHLPITDHLLPRLVDIWNITGGGGLIIQSPSTARFDKDFARVRKAAGLTHLRFHDLRGSFITRLAVNGATPMDIKKWSGHSLKSIAQVIDKHYLNMGAAGAVADTQFL